ncbi:Ca(2+)-dependent cysteine protease [Pleurotus pulmonarius]|nr:Ca(2+)-dependent cysteine protease [Pleurotus pulmonarius]
MDSGSPRKRALLIGIEYIRSRNPELGRLQGPAEEADDLASLLESHYDYYPEDIVILTDKDKNFLRRPTRDNIVNDHVAAMKDTYSLRLRQLREIDDLVADVEPGDQILFHYSGHCGQYPRLDGTEEDNLDEAIEALDGPILDDILKERLVDPLPAGSTLVVGVAVVANTCSEITFTASPMQEHHHHCPPTPGLNDLKPTVIAISAAKDSQASYWSITKIIVDILRKHRELPLEDLITQVSYEMYKETQREIKRHKWHPENEHHKPQYSHPSVSSLSYLNPKTRFTL